VDHGGYSVDDCLALVERSPTAVKAHDKQAWLAIFANCNIVEDPVGSAPHVTQADGQRSKGGAMDSLSAFYDTFIASNDIRFHVARDIVCGLHVVRDLTLEITMSSEVTVRVPMHLLYELREEEGELRIGRLAAHWELGPMLRQQLVLRRTYLKAGAASFSRMRRHLGIAGIAGFMRALSSVGDEGKQRVEDFARLFNNRGELVELFSAGNAVVAFPHGGERLTPAQLALQDGEFSFEKKLSAGRFVSASCSYRRGELTYRGVAFFEFDRGNLQIVALTFYWQ